jgi:hypothetical protein
MFRLMLDAHPQIANPGETDFLFDLLERDGAHPTGWRYRREELAQDRIFRSYALDLRSDLDGLDLLGDLVAQFRARSVGLLTLNVHRNAPMIAELFPAARIVHLLRDPRDVARSTIGMGWVGTSYHGAQVWIDAERGWDAALPRLAPDRVHTLHFEDLLAGPESELVRVCDFLGVPFSPAMLEYHRETTYDPPDPKLAFQWRRKAAAREVALIEGRCGDLLTARGYVPNGDPIRPDPWEWAALSVRHRTSRWRGNIRRFGLPLFLAEKLARLPGGRPLRLRLLRRMDDKITQMLK